MLLHKDFLSLILQWCCYPQIHVNFFNWLIIPYSWLFKLLLLWIWLFYLSSSRLLTTLFLCSISAWDLNSVKIADLGNAIRCVQTDLQQYFEHFDVQTFWYRAPEVWNKNGNINRDCWKGHMYHNVMVWSLNPSQPINSLLL